MRTLPTILIAVSLAACGSGAVNQKPETTCIGSLTGAVSESNISCTAAAGTDSNGDGNGAIVIEFTNPAGFSIVVGVATQGQPTIKTYASSDPGAQGSCEVLQTGSNQIWIAAAGSSGSDQGSYNLQVTSLGNELQNPDGGPGEVFLSVNGSVNCTVPALAVTGAAGTVNLVAKF